MRLLILMVIFTMYINAAEHNPLQYERYDDIVLPLLKMNSASMGGFMDAMKSYIVYTAIQNVPGTKESGVGYYYDNKSRNMKRVLFYRLSNLFNSILVDRIIYSSQFIPILFNFCHFCFLYRIYNSFTINNR